MVARNKELTDTKAELERVRQLYHKVREESEIINEKQWVLTEHRATMEVKTEECAVELAAEKERHITTEVELRRVTARYSTELERIIRECQE
ncbi:hypothetical protein PVK06_011914 [Gossypium arboreum]|uniref:Uncharacterized protein n=1 Tax=Gossypium arboreum TaxID=29729 RepID=A0ABR0QA73_GOSAR|nr:hypothetical protein PVK06_011914 [Gossypium arboreum]